MIHYFIVIYVIGISFSLIGVYVIMRVRSSWINIRGNIKAYKSYQQIYQALNHQYPDATKQELIIKQYPQKEKIDKIQDKVTSNHLLNENDNENKDENDDNIEYELCG